MSTPEEQTEGIPVDVHSDGVLWLINRVVFHPRGFALGHTPGTDEWVLLGAGGEPWSYADGIDDVCFAAVEALLVRAKNTNSDD